MACYDYGKKGNRSGSDGLRPTTQEQYVACYVLFENSPLLTMTPSSAILEIQKQTATFRRPRSGPISSEENRLLFAPHFKRILHTPFLRLLPAVLALVAFIAAGCSSTAPRSSRPKLSEAGEEASKPKHRQEKIEAPDDWYEEATDDDDKKKVIAAAILPEDGGGVPMAPVAGNRYEDDAGGFGLDPGERFRFGLVYGAGNITARAMDTYTQTGLLLGMQGNRFTADLRGFIGVPDLDETSEIQAVSGFKNVISLSLDGVARGYLMPDHTFLALGGLAGVRWGKVDWDYRNPIIVLEDDGETFTVKGDAVQYFSIFAGLSATPIRHGAFSFDLDFDGGYQFFGRTTDLAFENDLYKDSGFFEILAHLVYHRR